MKIGALKLTKYIDKTNSNPYRFSKVIGIDPSALHRILKGSTLPCIATALAIKDATNKEVDFEDWVKEAKK